MPGIRTRRVSWLNYWWLAYLQVSTYSKIFNSLYSLQWFSLVNQMHFIINLLKYSWEFRCFVFHFVCIVLLELSWFIPVSRKLFLLTINSVCKNWIKLSLIFFFHFCYYWQLLMSWKYSSFQRFTLRKKCPYSELFWLALNIQSECGKNVAQNNSEYGHFLRSVISIAHFPHFEISATPDSFKI